MITAESIDHLGRVSRAYNALYGMGMATPETVPTLSPEEASVIIQVAQEVLAMRERSLIHANMMTLGTSLLRYVAEGGL